MLYIPKMDDYLKVLTDDEVKGFVIINCSEYFKSKREKLYTKLSEEQNLRKVVESLCIFVTTSDKVEKYATIMQLNSSDKYVHRYNIEILNLFETELQLINTKPMIKNKLKELLSEVKNFKVQTILVLEYENRNDRKMVSSITNLIASDSDTDGAFKSMHQSIMAKIKNYG